jgi:hypothetical protein
MYEKDHLTKAREYSRLTGPIYFKHMFWALHSSFTLLFWSILMFIHSIVPQLVGFYVIRKQIEHIKHLKEVHPDDPLLKKVKFDESID